MRVALLLSLVALHPALARADRAAAPARVAEGDYLAPRFSPDGTRLLVTGPRWHGLAVIDIESGTARAITDEPRAGLTGKFLSDGRIAFDARRAGRTRTIALDADGRAAEVSPPRSRVFAHGDRVYLRVDDGVVPLGTGDRFFAPMLSPDGARVAFIGLATGLYVYDTSTGTLEHLGPGTAPSWAPDSSALAFERTEDDGHAIVASDIWIWRPGAKPIALATTDAIIARRPCWSPDGRALAFDDDRGAIYIATVPPNAEVER